MTIAHAFGLAGRLDPHGAAETLAFVCRHSDLLELAGAGTLRGNVRGGDGRGEGDRLPHLVVTRAVDGIAPSIYRSDGLMKSIVYAAAPPFRSRERGPLDLPLRCRCGRLRGLARDVSPSSGFRFLCYCRDCQAFARFLDRADVLDAAGGTDILHMPPGRVTLSEGADALRCLRLSNKVLRWYTDCCRTPIANTPAGTRFPVIGLVHSFMDHEADSRSRDEALGAPLCRIFERSAVGPLPPNAPGPPSVGLFARRASKMLGWWVRGLARPTPFFDDRTKAPRAQPRALTQSERAALT
jgi:hypothetical protein